MAKGSRKQKRGRSGGRNDTWSGADHAIHAEERQRKRLKKKNKTDNNDNHISERERRRQATTHETAEKRETIRLQLHLTKTKRELALLKERLEHWDPMEEAAKEEEAKMQQQLKEEQEKEEAMGKKKKKRYQRKGPETWKLNGAARPAHLVYEFDTRYVDPHQEAHDKAAAKAQRSINLLKRYKGRLGQKHDDGKTFESLREYLGLLMQLGHLSQEAKQFKTARTAWLECMELEGDDDPVTTARECLMRLYVQLGRHEAVLRLGGERLAQDSTSVVICYSTALVAIQESKTVSEDTLLQRHVVRAIKANPFCAYYLAFYDIFSEVMEFTDDIENSDEEPQSSLEEAIEYCASEQAASWKGEAAAILRQHVIRGANGTHEQLAKSDLHWEDRLGLIEKEYLSRQPVQPQCNRSDADTSGRKDESDTVGEADMGLLGGQASAQDSSQEDEDDVDDSNSEIQVQSSSVDLTMFIGMFRTAMEMIKEDGRL